EKIPRLVRRRRWRCSPDEHSAARVRACCPRGSVRFREVDVRREALQVDRGALLGLVPRGGVRRRERPGGHESRVRAPALPRGSVSGPTRKTRRVRSTSSAMFTAATTNWFSFLGVWVIRYGTPKTAK